MREVENPVSDIPALFTPFKLRGMTLANRVVLSPMCMYSALDGTVGDFQLVHLGARALGGSSPPVPRPRRCRRCRERHLSFKPRRCRRCRRALP